MISIRPNHGTFYDGTAALNIYGLRTSLLTLLLMALWRIKRPEGLKEHSPADLGRVLGLDRAPEVKTLRRKLAQLAAYGRAAQFGLEKCKPYGPDDSICHVGAERAIYRERAVRAVRHQPQDRL